VIRRSSLVVRYSQGSRLKVKSYKDLDVWKNGLGIADDVYAMTRHFPDEEKYNLAVQMQRSAISISSNIAEGFARNHKKEYVQFLYIALGSCAELDTQSIIAARRGYIDKVEADQLYEEIDHECRMIMNLIKAIR
jgi:four helix bundle protein